MKSRIKVVCHLQKNMAVGNYYVIDGLKHARVSFVISELTPPKEFALTQNAARDLGTQMHADIERYLCGETDRPFELKSQFLQFMDTYIKQEWDFLAAETLIFNTAARIAGTVDALFINKTSDKIMIVDWKRTRGLYPDSMLQYQLQLNLYRHIIGQHKVDVIGLVILHPEIHEFHFVNVPFIDVSVYMGAAIFL